MPEPQQEDIATRVVRVIARTQHLEPASFTTGSTCLRRTPAKNIYVKE